MMSNTNRAAEIVEESIEVGIYTHAMDGELELELHDYDAGKNASVSFDHSDGEIMANIELSGETSEVNLWVGENDARTLSDFFADLAKDIEQRG